ncbi:hypothetical protein JYU04_01945 [Dehalococcoides mccartyi]|nr:hypothetical protein [Dehalococcoides mccartyi]
MLLDCHPVIEPSAIEIRTVNGSIRVGELNYTTEFEQTIARAEESLKLLGEHKIFERRQSVDYTFLIHFQSTTEFFDYFEYWASYYDPLSDDLKKQIERNFARSGTEIVLDTRCTSTAFNKRG